MTKSYTDEQLTSVIEAAFIAASDAAAKHKVAYGDRDACGFAWVIVKPGTSKLARILKNKYKASSSYQGGIRVWNPSKSSTQSVGILKAGAVAFAKVLNDAGFDKVYAESSLD